MCAVLVTFAAPAPVAPTSATAATMAAPKLRIPFSCTSPSLGSLRDASNGAAGRSRHELTRRSRRFLGRRWRRFARPLPSADPGPPPPPRTQALDGPFELRPRQPERLRVGDLLDQRGGRAFADRIEHVPDREAGRDDEDRLRRPREDRAVAADVPRHGLSAAVATAWAHVLGPVCVRPRAVLGQEAPLELPETDVVELCEHEAGDVAALERWVGGFPRPLELGGDAEADRLVAELDPEPARLLAADRGQRDANGWGAVRQAVDGALALAVARQDQSLHDRFTLTRDRPRPAVADHADYRQRGPSSEPRRRGSGTMLAAFGLASSYERPPPGGRSRSRVALR